MFNTSEENPKQGLSSDGTGLLRRLQSFAEHTGNEGESLWGQGHCTKLTWEAIRYHIIVTDMLNRKKIRKTDKR